MYGVCTCFGYIEKEVKITFVIYYHNYRLMLWNPCLTYKHNNNNNLIDTIYNY